MVRHPSATLAQVLGHWHCGLRALGETQGDERALRGQGLLEGPPGAEEGAAHRDLGAGASHGQGQPVHREAVQPTPDFVWNILELFALNFSYPRWSTPNAPPPRLSDFGLCVL